MENSKQPAYPIVNSDGYTTNLSLLESEEGKSAIGLTKLEYAAIIAMQGILANENSNPTNDNHFKNIAAYSIRAAKELLKQLEQ